MPALESGLLGMELHWQEVLRDVFAISSLAVLAESGGVIA